MSDLSARPSSTLAITEKKPHIQRSGGCVGIFFQLFDWNRRFAKKKLFPKKLLPPVRTKVSKKFNAEEKLPVIKHLLIADENNCREFPSKLKKNRELESTKYEMQAPGLVARLMGLEALPVSADEHDKSNKDSSKGKGEKFGGGISNGLAKYLSLSPEKGNVRPQKIQKTGVLERKPITRFGAEALQIKNVLSRSRKHHHHHHHHHHNVYPKPVSPVKSPKTGRATSRLIDVATRILEPGIQTTNRARCSLTYSNSTRQQPWKDEVMNEVRGDNDLETKAACRNFGNMFEHIDRNHRSFNHNDDEKSRNAYLPDANFSREIFFHDLEENRSRPAVYLENENDVVLLKSRYQPECLNAQPVDSRSQKKETIRNRTNQSPSDEQIPISRMFTSQKGASPSVAPKHRAQTRGQMLAGDRAPPKSKMATLQEKRLPSGAHPVNESKDFIALNRNVSRDRLKAPVKSDISVEVDRRFCTGKGDSLATQRSPVRKRRNLNVNKEVDSAYAASSSGPSLEKQRSNKINIVSGNGTKTRSDPVNHTSLRSRTANPRGNKTPEVVSFTFNSPVKTTKGQTSDDMNAKRRDPNCSVTSNNLKQRLTTDENGVKQSSQNYLRMNGDALGALLEQKLKELSLQVENEAAAGFVPSARTTASILQELISALTVEKPDSCEVGSHVSTDTQGSQCDTKIEDSVLQANLRNKRSSDGFCGKADHFSPGCVLDASFSNDSCISSRIDDNSVKPVSSIDSDILDSASSTNNHRGRGVVGVTDIVNHASAVLQNVNRVHSRLTATKLHYVQEIVVNAELLFGSNASDTSSGILDFLVGPLLDELESLVLAAWKNSIILGIEPRKDESPLRRFLFDCLVECLNVRYIRYSDSGFRALAKLPKSIDAEVLIKVFDEEVRKWISFSGKTTDEIIETEMSTSLGKWTDFEIEEFETGAEISEEVVQVLVDELVADLRF